MATLGLPDRGDDGRGAPDAPVFNLDPYARNLDQPLVPIYHRSRYVECQGTTPAGGPPNAKC